MLKNRGDVSSMRAVLMLLRDFLGAVARADKKVFESFFADDVIYTGSTGMTMGKAEIMKGLEGRADDLKATYRAENITVHPYTDMAVVNFRMVMHDENGGKRKTAYFRNTGTFLKRNGKWQVVAWHATEIPQAEE